VLEDTEKACGLLNFVVRIMLRITPPVLGEPVLSFTQRFVPRRCQTSVEATTPFEALIKTGRCSNDVNTVPTGYVVPVKAAVLEGERRSFKFVIVPPDVTTNCDIKIISFIYFFPFELDIFTKI